MTLYRYDVVTLMELIETRPCLWDKSLDAFKDKIAKQRAWNEILRFLEEGYDELSANEKKLVVARAEMSCQSLSPREHDVRTLKTQSLNDFTANYKTDLRHGLSSTATKLPETSTVLPCRATANYKSVHCIYSLTSSQYNVTR